MPITSSDQIAANTLWVELGTRIATQRLHYRSGSEETAAESIHRLFPKTRELMETHPDAKEFGSLALKMLNDTVRPCTARWHGWMTEDNTAADEQGRPILIFRDEWVKRQFRRELRELQPRLLGYLKAFEAMKNGTDPQAWWTSPDDAQLATLCQECAEAAEVTLGAALPVGIADQVRFGRMTEDGRKALCKQINDAEQNEIRTKRGATTDDRPIMDATGLAFSGGGIRSATFCLGITQVLARRGLLAEFDYLSTVSGGGYCGSFLSAYLGTGAPVPLPPQPPDAPANSRRSEQQARIDEIFKPGPDQREQRPLRHLRNNSRYLVDDGFIRKTVQVSMVAAGILFNLLIVLPVPLVAALLTVWLNASEWMGDKKWTSPSNQWFPASDAIGTRALLGALGATLLSLLAYPWLKAHAIRSTRETGRRPLRLWQVLFLGSAGAAIVLLICWLIPPAFHLYGALKSGAAGSWLKSLTNQIDNALSVVGLTMAALLGKMAARAKSGAGSAAFLKNLAILAGPFIYALVYYRVTYRMLFAPPADLWCWPYVLLGAALMAVWAWCLVDVNTYSPHGYYRDRLSSCYLQAPKQDKSEPALLDLAHVDRLRLTELNAHTAAPYHLINSTVNLPSSKLRDIRGRNGDFFLFSKHYCGSPMCGYFPTTGLEAADPHLDLGTAMAISGAAASSNMGWQTSNALRLVITLGNVRLGYWLRNPARGPDKAGKALRPGPGYLFREMFGFFMDEKQNYLNLSDGGHIENLGAYELLRRRCKFIVCVDAGMEPDMHCADLIRLERYAAIDFGIKLHYDLNDLLLQPNGFSRAYGVLVKIDYDPQTPGSQGDERPPSEAKWGWMLYLKLAMVGYGPGYVMDYKRTHPDFPHTTTADQVYDEGRFEAYRALGEAAAESFFSEELIGGQTPSNIRDWFKDLAQALLPDNDVAFLKMESNLKGT